MKQFVVSKNFIVFVDDEDFEDVNQYTWCVKTPPKRDHYYAGRNFWKNGKVKWVYLHRYILKIQDKKTTVDHIDGNTFNNQKSNLRLCSLADNNKNRKIQINNTTGYK